MRKTPSASRSFGTSLLEGGKEMMPCGDEVIGNA